MFLDFSLDILCDVVVQTLFCRAPCTYDSTAKRKCKAVFFTKLKNIETNTDIYNVS